MSPKAFGAGTSGDEASPLQPAARRSRALHFVCNAAFLFLLEGSETKFVQSERSKHKQPTIDNQIEK